MSDLGLEVPRGSLGIADTVQCMEPVPQSMHVANVALAAAVAGIELIISDNSPAPTLSAMHHTADGAAPFPRRRWLARPGTLTTASGMELKSRLEFVRRDRPNRNLPTALDDALLSHDHAGFSVAFSKVTLERPSPVIDTVRTIVGIQMDHAPHHRQPEVEFINGGAGPVAFSGLLLLLRSVSRSRVDYSILEDWLTHIEVISPTQPFIDHFSFDQNLGTPPEVVLRAQQNFAAITEVIDRATI